MSTVRPDVGLSAHLTLVLAAPKAEDGAAELGLALALVSDLTRLNVTRVAPADDGLARAAFAVEPGGDWSAGLAAEAPAAGLLRGRPVMGRVAEPGLDRIEA